MNRPPNILVVCTDQQRTDTLGCYGGAHATPGFDRIAADGIVHERAFCASAVCTPSRVSLLSGGYAARHGVWSIGVNTGADVTMMQHRLAAAGYRTGLVGKAHLEAYGASAALSRESVEGFERGYGDWGGPYHGFERVRLALGHVNYGMTGHYGAWLRERHDEATLQRFKHLERVTDGPAFGGEAYRFALPAAHHNSVWTADSAIDFIESDDGRPFFLFASFQDPHHPHALPADHEPGIAAASVAMPDAVDGELDDKPEHFRLARPGALGGSRWLGPTWPMAGQGAGADFRDIDDEAIVQGRRFYHGMVGLIDAQLDRLWRTLERRGLYDDTLIVVTSDHGELLGDHGLWMKGPFHYDAVTRVPLLLKPPRAHPCAAPATRRDGVVSLVDVAPTCLGVAGIDTDPDLDDGVDLLGAAPSPGRGVLVETTQDWHGLVCKSLVTRDWKLTWYADETFGELYDREADPSERTNLWDSAAHQRVRAGLISRLLDRHVRMGRSTKARLSYA